MKSQLYKKLAEQICADYASVRILPAERTLGERYVATRTTIRAALQYLQEQGRLQTTPRKGHVLIADQNKPEIRTKNFFNVVVFCISSRMEDQAFLDFLSGLLHEASLRNINVTIREIEESRLVSGDRYEIFHCGIEADGYILTFLSEGLRHYLERTLKPCVALGGSDIFRDSEKRRFFRIFLQQVEKHQFLLTQLKQCGHQKIFLPVWPNTLGSIADPALHIQQVPRVVDSTVPNMETVETVCATLKKNAYSALQLPFGGATALEIYRRILASGVEIPKRLSLTIDSSRYDYWIRVFDITTAYSSPRDEGILCMTTLAEQLQSGFLEFGDRFSTFTYVEGNTIAAAMTPEEISEYDRLNPWREKL